MACANEAGGVGRRLRRFCYRDRMSGELVDLMKGEGTTAIAALARGIERAVQDSFENGSVMIFRTGHEERRRVHLCVQIARELRNELKWSAQRIADALPRALRAKLDGLPFDPEAEG